MRSRLVLAAVSLVTLAAKVQAEPCLPPTPVPDFQNAVIRTTDLGHGIYMLDGANGAVGGNVTVAVADDGLILVDDMFPQMYGKLKAAITAVSRHQPVRYLVNTHFPFRPHRRQRSLLPRTAPSSSRRRISARVLATGSRSGLNCAVIPPAPEIASARKRPTRTG